jgi:hypothetical protein
MGKKEAGKIEKGRKIWKKELISTSRKGNNQLNKVHLCNRGKCLSVFYSFLLRKSLHNQARFMMFNNTFKEKFHPIDPSTLHNIIYLQLGN